MTPAGMHAAIREELLAHAEPWKLPVMQRFFKEKIDAYCTYTVHVRNIAKAQGKTFSEWTPAERVELTEALWRSGKFEEGAVAIQLFARMRRKCGRAEWLLLKGWLGKHIRNWAHCDALCGDVLGLMLIAHPDWIADVEKWAGARALYQRRAALVAPIKGIRKGMFREEAAGIAARMADETEDILKKGLVWLRKEMTR